MERSPALHDLVSWSHHRAHELRLQDVMQATSVWRAQRSMGGSHTLVVYPVLDALPECAPDDILSRIKPERGINLYAHIAFCEFQCPFCHYETDFRRLGLVEDAKTDAYMDALSTEWRQWEGRLAGGSLGSLYVGGGTPTAIPAKTLIAFLEGVLAFPRESSFSFCVETSPATAAGSQGADTLKALAEVGVDRLSMGIQATGENHLRRTRGHDVATLKSAMNNLRDTGIAFNIDLIQDLPDQNDADLLEDLTFVAEWRPKQVTWYIMRLDPNSSWYRRRDENRLNVPSAMASARRRLLVLEGMRRLGYSAQPGGRFSLGDEPDPYKKVRGGLNDTLLGLGASAYSHGWGSFFRNVASREGVNGIHEYTTRIAQGRSPIATGMVTTPRDDLVSRMINNIRGELRLGNDLSGDPAYAEQVHAVLSSLVAAGVAETTENAYRLTELGRAFEEEVCAMFIPQTIQDSLERSGADIRKSSYGHGRQVA